MSEKGGGLLPEPLIAAVDVQYCDGRAQPAAVWFRGWTAEAPIRTATAIVENVAEYVPGEFYRRELPCILEVLAKGDRPEIIVVDGYVWLADGAPGLGKRLHDATGIPVVGVAKTMFLSATDAVPVLRGSSQAPLFVSAVGLTADEAARHVASMHGPYRVPALLKLVDAQARTGSGSR